MTASTDSERAQSGDRAKRTPTSIRLAAACAVALAALQAQAHAVLIELGEPAAQPPVALVVGNSDYEHVPREPAGTNDAEAVAQALVRLGFQVVERTNLNRMEFIEQVIDFHRRSRGRSAALFYYSGHAASGRSFDKGRVIDALLPVDTPEGRNLVGLGVDVADVLAGMDGDVNLMLLDAEMTARPRVRRMNTLIAYAGEMTIDELDHQFSVRFTQALLAAMAPGVDIVDLLQQVIGSFSADSASLPWMESSLRQPYRLPSPARPLAHKLDERLVHMLEQLDAGGAEAVVAYGAANSVDVDGASVAVHIVAKSESDVAAIRRGIEVAFGNIEAVFENNVYASLPVAVIGTFARSDAVHRIDLAEAVFAPPDSSIPSPISAPDAPSAGQVRTPSPSEDNE